jgi:hypothetical protein
MHDFLANIYSNCIKTSRKQNWENKSASFLISEWKKNKTYDLKFSKIKFLLQVIYKLIQNSNHLKWPFKQSLANSNTYSSKIQGLMLKDGLYFRLSFTVFSDLWLMLLAKFAFNKKLTTFFKTIYYAHYQFY